jgi:hypothetical protein
MEKLEMYRRKVVSTLERNHVLPYLILILPLLVATIICTWIRLGST